MYGDSPFTPNAVVFEDVDDPEMPFEVLEMPLRPSLDVDTPSTPYDDFEVPSTPGPLLVFVPLTQAVVVAHETALVTLASTEAARAGWVAARPAIAAPAKATMPSDARKGTDVCMNSLLTMGRRSRHVDAPASMRS
jgi:hypothetical protein